MVNEDSIKLGNPNRLVKAARKKNPIAVEDVEYLFNPYTGEIKFACQWEFGNGWYYLTNTFYPVYEKDEFIGAMWGGVFRYPFEFRD